MKFDQIPRYEQWLIIVLALADVIKDWSIDGGRGRAGAAEGGGRGKTANSLRQTAATKSGQILVIAFGHFFLIRSLRKNTRSLGRKPPDYITRLTEIQASKQSSRALWKIQ